jgi:hypothetical protein
MKKKILAMMMVCAMSLCVFTACGDDEGSSAPATEESADADEGSGNTSLSSLTDCYAGMADDGVTCMFLGFNDDADFGCVAVYDKDSGESGSWVGAVQMDEAGTIGISDESNGTQLGFSVEATDGGYKLDMGDLGIAYVSSIDSDTFVECIEAIDAGSEPQF